MKQTVISRLTTIKHYIILVLLVCSSLSASAQAPNYTVSWFKTDCAESVNTPVEIRVDMVAFAASTSYIYELYEDPSSDPFQFPAANPILLNPISSATTTTANNQSIDAVLSGGMFDSRYYVKVYPSSNVNAAVVKSILTDRSGPSTANPVGAFISSVDVFTQRENCNSTTKMNVFLGVHGSATNNLSYQWASSTMATIPTDDVRSPTLAINDANGQPHVYNVTISDQFGCVKYMDNIQYTAPQPFPNLRVDVIPFDRECSTITADIIGVTNNGLSYSYLWRKLDGTIEDITNRPRSTELAPGTSYMVEILTGNGNCFSQAIPVFRTPDAISCTTGALSGDPCVNGSAANITINALFDVGVGTYSYELTGLSSNNANCSTVVSNAGPSITISSLSCGGGFTTGIPVGKYLVSVIGNDCEHTKEIQVGENLNDINFDILVTDVFCQDNGMVTITPQDPSYSGSLSYSTVTATGGSVNAQTINSSQNGNVLTLTDIPAGSYSLTTQLVSATLPSNTINACTRTLNFTVQNNGLAITNTFTTSACTATGGPPHGSILIELNNNNPLDIDADGVPDEAMFEWTYPDGTVVSSPGQNSIEELVAGIYTVTISIGTCVVTKSIQIYPNDLMVTHERQDNWTEGGCDLMTGAATLKVTDGGSDITQSGFYIWADANGDPVGNNTNQLTGVSNGTYSVTVTANNCTVTYPITIGVVVPEFSFVANAYCGDNNGRATIDVNNNNAFYPAGLTLTLFNWQIPSTATTSGNLSPFQIATEIPPGNYQVKFTLRNTAQDECTFSVPFEIKAITPPPAYTTTLQAALCGVNGAARVQGTGYPLSVQSNTGIGIAPQYTWLASNGSDFYSGSTIGILPPDTYSLIATYGTKYSACDQTIPNLVIGNLQPTIVVKERRDIGCGGPGMVVVETNVQGTQHSYQLVLKSADGTVLRQGTSPVFNNLAAGTYSIDLITTQPNCQASVGFTIEAAGLELLAQAEAVCGQGGSIKVHKDNASYSWSNGSTSDFLTGLTPGSYTVTATNAISSCINTYVIGNRSLVVTNTTIVQDCDRVGAGAITVETNNPTASYRWNTGARTAAINNLSAGIYRVTISDPNSTDGTCMLYRSFTIYDGFDLSVAVEQPTCAGGNDGSLQAVAANTSASIVGYEWDGLGIPVYGSTLSDLTAGDYTLTATDANGCERIVTSYVVAAAPLSVTIALDPSLTCGATATVVGGVAPYTVNWGLLELEETIDLNNTILVPIGRFVNQSTVVAAPNVAVGQDKLNPGSYSATVVDANGCIVEDYGQIEIAPVQTVLPDMYFRWKAVDPANNNTTDAATVVDATTIRARVIADNVETEIKTALDNFGVSLQQATCDQITAVTDQTALSYELKYHHYTLYYYNRRGELTRTVPPAGVDFLDASEVTAIKDFRAKTTTTAPLLPVHSLVTTYHYDAAGRSIESSSPDAGLVRQAFRSDGLVRLSQDARQKQFGVGIPALGIAAGAERMTYIKYDKLNRVIEQGEMELPRGNTDFDSYLASQGRQDMDNPLFPADNTTLVKTEWVKTYYSNPHLIDNTPIVYHGQTGEEQRFLRNRVSYTESWNGIADGVSNVNAAAITTCSYSYDPHGNVEWIRNYVPGLGDNYIRMEYDLISRNVHKVAYNEWGVDQFFHRYAYDEQNRITTVETSRDNLIWDKDGRYDYYEHGPLKRKEIGDDRIQGMDYTYTIHGWLKAINHPYLNRYRNDNANGTSAVQHQNDPGQDGYAIGGNANEEVLKDVWSFSLGYYKGDYSRRNPTGTYNAMKESIRYNTNHELYNGNISYWMNGVRNQSAALGAEERLTQRKFWYDNLNRIVKSQLKATGDVNDPRTMTSYGSRFKTTYSYDPNGNLETLERWDGTSGSANQGTKIDELKYNYTAKTNQLAAIDDARGVVLADESDIGNQQYEYDARGNIIKITDNGLAQPKITYIQWLNTGKVKVVQIDSDGNGVKDQEIEYVYDAMGNRVAKLTRKLKNIASARGSRLAEAGGIKNTYYVRDASGNSMSIYERSHRKNGNTFLPPFETTFKLKEQLIYGSDRVGTVDYTVELGSARVSQKDALLLIAGLGIGQKSRILSIDYAQGSRLLGEKEYDLTDHLGNVTVQLSDRKAGVADNNGRSSLKAKIISYQQYYAFGWNMPGRTKSGDEARFGFNGMEKNPELEGSYTTEYRQLDTRIARWLSIDPLTKKYPGQSPYSSFNNNPVYFKDPTGLEGDPPKKLYTNTNAGHGVFTEGFKGSQYGKFSSYNWFSSVLNASTTGRSGVGVSLEVDGIDVSKAEIITKAQTKAWSAEAMSEMGYDNASWKETIKNSSRKVANAMNAERKGRMWSKVGAYMDAMGKDVYYTAVDGNYAVSDVAANKGRITAISGENASTVAKALKGVKYLNRTLLVVGVSVDVYRIYTSENRAKTITKVAGGWSGAIMAGGATAKVMSPALYTGPWGWVGYGVVVTGASVGGYWLGEKITETVYEKLESKGWVPGGAE